MSEDLGKFLLRVVLGVLILLHGLGKLTGGIGPIVGLVEKAGLPGAFGYLVFVGEVAAPILLIAGVWTRLAGAVVAINMLVAVALAHTGDLAKLSKTGGWALELQGMFLLAAVVIALIGAGRWSLAGPKGRFN